MQDGGGGSSRDESGDQDKGQEEGVGEETSGGAVQLADVNDAGGEGGSGGQTNPLSSSDKAEGGEDSAISKGEEEKD